MVILLDSRLVKQMKKPKKKTIIKSSIFLFLIISILFLNFSTSDQIESTDFVFKLIHVATYDTPDAAVGVFVDDNIAYIADQHEDLQIINVTKPSNPTFISQGEFTSSTRYGIEVRDSYCYIAGWNNRLAIFNVSNPSLPDLVYSDYGSNDACDFDIIDDLIYIADFIHGFYIYNISEPTSPVALGSYSGYQAIDIKIREDLAYLATLDGLLILNVSDVLNPVYVNLYSTPDRIDGIVIDSNYMYIAGGTQGLIILDITDKVNPVYVNSYDTPSFTSRLALKNNHTFICDASGGLYIVNVTNLHDLTLTYELTEYDQAINIFFEGNYAYLANGIKGLEIFYIDDTYNQDTVTIIDPTTIIDTTTITKNITITETGTITILGSFVSIVSLILVIRIRKIKKLKNKKEKS